MCQLCVKEVTFIYIWQVIRKNSTKLVESIFTSDPVQLQE